MGVMARAAKAHKGAGLQMGQAKVVQAGGEDDHIFSLPHLQNLIKRDAPAYEAEYNRQYAHFESQLEIFKLKPQKPSKQFHELVMFLAHTSGCYMVKDQGTFAEVLTTVLENHHAVLHGSTRKTLVQCLTLMRNRDQFPLLRVLPVYFKLFKCNDKLLRTSLMQHIVKDVERTWKTNPNNKAHTEIQQYVFYFLSFYIFSERNVSSNDDDEM